MNEILIRELMLFGGAAAGVVWGFLLGGLVVRRRLARAMGSDLETLERWSVAVCRRLDRLEPSLSASPASEDAEPS